MRSLTLSLVMLVAALGGCSEREREPGGLDRTDASIEIDGSTWGGVDSGPSTGSDGGFSGTDGGATDAGATDAGRELDGGSTRDGGTDAGPVGVDAGPPPPCPDDDLGDVLGEALITDTTVGAMDRISPTCGGGGGPERAFLWTAPENGTYTFDTNGSGYDTVLSLRSSGDCLAPELDCDDDGGEGLRSRITTALSAGEQVVVVVGGFSGDTGDFILSILADVPLSETSCTDGADDDRDGAVDCDDSDCDTDPACMETNCADGLDDEGDGYVDCDDSDCTTSSDCGETLCGDGADDDGDGYTDCDDSECACDLACVACPQADLASAVGASVATGSNAGLCSALEGSCAGGGGGEVTYSFTAPAAGSYTFDTVGSTYDTQLYLLEGSCGGAELACDDDTAGLQSEVTVTLSSGQTVIVVVDAFSSSSSGDYVLNITAP